jgi:prophage tail gpP-like protein
MPSELDEIELRVEGFRITRFIRYSVVSDLFSPEGSFDFEFSNSYTIKAGAKAEIFVNGRLEFTGLIDRVSKTTSKSGSTRSASGRSIFSVLVDSSVTDFRSAVPNTLPELAARLVKDLPFISKKDFEFRSGSDKVKVRRSHLELTPGDSVFEVLKRAANSQGYIFYATADGVLVFDKPKKSGQPVFVIRGRFGHIDYIDGTVTESIEGRHSEITIRGEYQNAAGETRYAKATVQAGVFPFFRPYVEGYNEENGSAKRTAELRRDAENAGAVNLEYIVAGHSQNGINWAINEFCRVEDESNEIAGSFLVISREFSLSKDQGRRAALTLQLGGAFE